jgi:hypothetical protein
MAKQTAGSAPSNSEIRFERTDITAGTIVKCGVGLGAGVGLVVLTMLWYGRVLQAEYRKPDPLDLPRASTDDDRRPPEPRLEALEDLGEGKALMFPTRAADYYKPQLEQLKDGGEGVLPIESAMDAVTESLPVRKAGDRAAPKSFTIRLPGKASSGRAETGGQ